MTAADESPTFTAAGLIVAAGRGRRLDARIPKAFLQLGVSPLFIWSLRAFEHTEQIDQIILVVPVDYCEQAASICREAEISKLTAVVGGGERRADSVYAGLDALSSQPPDIIAIHDGARPFVTPDIITRTIDAVQRAGAAIAARPVTDTLKQVGADSEIVATADRSRFWQAQTPQTFRFATIYRAYGEARAQGWEATDDAALVERAGGEVVVVEDTPGNFKVTSPEDWAQAQRLVAGAGGIRVGHGYDVHPFAAERRLMLGGVEIPYDRGLAGHSDADVVLHALADALLGAAGLGDIGQHFPDTDPTLREADSAELLGEVLRLAGKAGYRPTNVDVTVIAQQPRLAPHIPQMRKRIANILQMQPQAVNIKATTTEGLGFIGRQEGIVAQAVVLVGPVGAGQLEQA